MRTASTPWQHVRLVGEDVVASEPLLPRGHRIRPFDVAALIAAGRDQVAVRPRPRVAILPTGTELIEPGAPREPGRVVEFNSRMIAAFVQEWGGAPVRLPPVVDDPEILRQRLTQALEDEQYVAVGHWPEGVVDARDHILSRDDEDAGPETHELEHPA